MSVFSKDGVMLISDYLNHSINVMFYMLEFYNVAIIFIIHNNTAGF